MNEEEIMKYIIDSKKPPYYKVVNIEYWKGGRKYEDKAWLAVSDNGEYIWTLYNSDEIIMDSQIINWWL